MSKGFKWLLTVQGGATGILVLLISCMVLSYAYFYIVERIALRPISLKLGIDSWKELDRYIDKTFVEGMSREEVYKELAKFGDYKITPTAWGRKGEGCELVGLPTGYFVNFSNLQYLACFSTENNSLVRWTLDD
jgi:hypothetical protein